jgi:hypothetical protein
MLPFEMNRGGYRFVGGRMGMGYFELQAFRNQRQAMQADRTEKNFGSVWLARLPAEASTSCQTLSEKKSFLGEQQLKHLRRSRASFMDETTRRLQTETGGFALAPFNMS